jgi:hypothetical protein
VPAGDCPPSKEGPTLATKTRRPPLFGVMVLGTPTVSRDLAMRKRTVLKGRVILAGHSTVCGCAHPDAVCKMVPYR